jgi:hypothetical protein
MLAQILKADENQNGFDQATDSFERLKNRLNSPITDNMTSSEIEKTIKEQGDNVNRLLYEATLNRIGSLQASTPVIGSDGVECSRKRLMERTIESRFGEVTYVRWGYKSKEGSSLFPADGHLNLPPEKYTLELRRWISEDASKMSYDEAIADLSSKTSAKVPKRQGLELANRTTVDFVEFYDERAKDTANPCFIPNENCKFVLLSTDGKGVVMRPEGLREGTRKAADKAAEKKLATGREQSDILPGEKKDRKRMAQVASVCNRGEHVRTPEEIVGVTPRVTGKKGKDPIPQNKRTWASLAREPAEVIGEMFMEAHARDPEHQKMWVALVDGNKKQLELLIENALALGVMLTIVIDIIHVIEYIWKAAHVFYKEGDPQCGRFVSELVLQVLRGKSDQVAKLLAEKATALELSKDKRKAVDKCTSYLTTYQQYLRYDQYLAQGMPIATGIIEGACRYLVKDRMDITGARWGLPGGEAVLKLRSIRTNGDFDEYWRFHLKKERERNHESKYENGQLPPLKNYDDSPAGTKSERKLTIVSK